MNKYQMRQLPLSVAVSSVLAAGSLQAAVITVDSALDAPTGTYVGDCTLRAAIEAANTDTALDGCLAGGAGADEIVFTPGLATSTITLGSELAITDSLSITGPVANDPSSVVLSGNNLVRVMRIEGAEASPIDVTLNSLSLENGYLVFNSAETGAGIFSQNANLNLANVNVANNYAYDGGGGIVFSNGDLSLLETSVTNNRAGFYQNGGGMTVSSASLLVMGGQISGNSAYSGGGLALLGSTASLYDTQINNNFSDSYFGGPGAGASVVNSTLTAYESQFNGNSFSAQGYGGGIGAVNSAVMLYASQASYNSVGYYFGSNSGGGISVSGGSLTLNGSSVNGNDIEGYSGYGAGIRATNASISLSVSTVSGNEVIGDNASGGNYGFGDSGGLHLIGVSGAIRYTEISDNQVQAPRPGGGGMTIIDSTLDIINSTLSGNRLVGVMTTLETGVSPDEQRRGDNTGAGITVSGPSTVVDLIHVTMADNTGVDVIRTVTVETAGGGSFNLINSIISGPAEQELCNSSAASYSRSLVTDFSCTLYTSTTPAELALASLESNGGFNRTHAIDVRSVAVNAAGSCFSDLGIQYDQRGEERNGLCDIGAFEAYLGDVIFNDRFEALGPP